MTTGTKKGILSELTVTPKFAALNIQHERTFVFFLYIQILNNLDRFACLSLKTYD